MKTYGYSSRRPLILMTTCLLFLSTYAARQAMSSDAQSRRAVVAESAVVQPIKGAARLIVRRDPALGNYLIVHLRVDGVLVGVFGYGRRFCSQAFLIACAPSSLFYVGCLALRSSSQ